MSTHAYQPPPPRRPAAPRTLAELAPGEGAVVLTVDVSAPIGRRLQDLGFLPGTPVRTIRQAPLGDPVVYELRGTRLCLRRSEARLIRVRPE